MAGLFFSFEGVDGCGKSTQIRFAREYLEEKGYSVLVTREPGGCVLSEKIRDLLLDVDNADMTDRTEALLYAAARAQHVRQVIVPARQAGKIVLCDRFIDSSLAYQGVGRSLGIDEVMAVNLFATGGVMPDYTFFLDYPPQKAFERMSKKRVYDRLESQSRDFYNKLYEGFVELCGRYPDRMIRMNVDGDKFDTQRKLRARLDDILKEAGI